MFKFVCIVSIYPKSYEICKIAINVHEFYHKSNTLETRFLPSGDLDQTRSKPLPCAYLSMLNLLVAMLRTTFLIARLCSFITAII